nr:NAD(P)-binding protein [uncultured Pedobacter sp.]
MKIGIVGAGVSGLSIAKLLSAYYRVEILESNDVVGGIARTKNINGVPYHPVGGHCFNSKYPEVLDFVFKEVLAKENWNVIKRKSAIQFQNHLIPYPIEYSVKEIFKFDQTLAINIVRDFLDTDKQQDYRNLDEWFRGKFGDALAENYFIPYNHKIWNLHPAEMNHTWVKDKLPVPDKESFIKNFFEHQRDEMSHYTFYYPKGNHLNTFIEGLASNLDIKLNYQVQQIKKNKEKSKWVINNEKEYDIIISTIPLNIIPSLISDCPKQVLDDAKKLKYNKVSTMLWESHETENTWTYIPKKDSIFHRYIHISNFSNSEKNHTITESIGERTFSEMEECGKKDPFLIKPLDFNISNHAYVVFDQNYDDCKFTVKKYLEQIGIYTLGRFGEWEYYNMDICIKKSLELSEFIKEKY